MIRKAFVIRVREGMEEEYERRHNPIWKELETELKDCGISNYSIFLHPATRYLFCYMEIADLNRMALLANSPVCQRWWKEMTTILEVENPTDLKAWEEELQQVFYLP